jgi:hypothetical protein
VLRVGAFAAPTKPSGTRPSQSKVFPELGKQALAENL